MHRRQSVAGYFKMFEKYYNQGTLQASNNETDSVAPDVFLSKGLHYRPTIVFIGRKWPKAPVVKGNLTLGMHTNESLACGWSVPQGS